MSYEPLWGRHHQEIQGENVLGSQTFYGETAKEVGFSFDLQEEVEAVVSFPDMESLMDWCHGTD